MTRPAAHEIVTSEVEGRQGFTLVSPAGLTATAVPDLAMLCSSLRAGDTELLGFPGTVADYADRDVWTAIPLLHPWANRLSGPRLAGVDRDTIDPASPVVPTDDNGLAIHGLRLVDAGWRVTSRETGAAATVAATVEFGHGDLLAAFPFPHHLTVVTSLAGDTLTITTELTATGAVAVPVAFGWHPYFRLPDVPRAEWIVSLPVRRRALLDARQLPTGETAAVLISEGPIGRATYDDCFTELEDPAVFVLAGGDRRIEVAFGEGYAVAQVYAPPNLDVIAFEPMTAPVNAVVSGESLRRVEPGETFRAVFRVRVSG